MCNTAKQQIPHLISQHADCMFNNSATANNVISIV